MNGPKGISEKCGRDRGWLSSFFSSLIPSRTERTESVNSNDDDNDKNKNKSSECGASDTTGKGDLEGQDSRVGAESSLPA